MILKKEMMVSGCVHLWQAQLSKETTDLHAESILSAMELARAKQFIKPIDQTKFIVSKAITRKILARYLHCHPVDVQFYVGEHGKPFIIESDLQFNVSHSGDYLLLGVTRENAIGVDIECARASHDFLALAKRFFADSEYHAILTSDDQRAAFYRCWTCKEAFIKATGLGLSFGLNNFVVDMITSSLLCVSRNGYVAKNWTVQSIALNQIADCYAAFSVKNAVKKLVVFNV